MGQRGKGCGGLYFGQGGGWWWWWGALPTSSLMPEASSIMTQASMGSAISRPKLLRCVLRGTP